MQIARRQIGLLLIALATVSSAAGNEEPKRIDGGILIPNPESVKEIIRSCTPIRIVISFIILEDGTTTNFEVIETDPEGVDVLTAIDAIRQMQFEPILIDGVPTVSSPQLQEFTYDPSKDANCNGDGENAPPNKSLQQMGEDSVILWKELRPAAASPR